jgi:hypothetical protein
MAKFVQAILELCDHPLEKVSTTAIESLSSLTLLYDKIYKNDKLLILTIVTNVCDKVIQLIQTNPLVRGKIFFFEVSSSSSSSVRICDCKLDVLP